jgi:hypothetical protein
MDLWSSVALSPEATPSGRCQRRSRELRVAHARRSGDRRERAALIEEFMPLARSLARGLRTTRALARRSGSSRVRRPGRGVRSLLSLAGDMKPPPFGRAGVGATPHDRRRHRERAEHQSARDVQRGPAPPLPGGLDPTRGRRAPGGLADAGLAARAHITRTPPSDRRPRRGAQPPCRLSPQRRLGIGRSRCPCSRLRPVASKLASRSSSARSRRSDDGSRRGGVTFRANISRGDQAVARPVQNVAVPESPLGSSDGDR